MPVTPPAPESYRRVLVLRGDSLGDALLSTPALDALRRALPEAALEVVVRPTVADALATHPSISRVIPWDDIAGNLFTRLGFALSLGRPPYDLALIFTEKMWGYWAALGSGAPARAGFWPGRSKPGKCLLVAPCLTRRVPFADDPSVASGKHEVERYMDLVRAAGLPATAGHLTLGVTAEDEAAAGARLAGTVGDGPLIGFHLTRKWQDGGWPQGWIWKILIRVLEDFPDARVLVTYGPAEQAWAPGLLDTVKNPRVIPFYDARVRVWAAALRRCRALITMDTSAVHLAAAMGVPVVDLFPDAHYRHCTERWAPWQTPHVLVKKPALPPNATEMTVSLTTELVTEAVVKGVGRLLGRAGAGSGDANGGLSPQG